MPRNDAFDAFYRESRARILHQTYAYVGDTEVAQKATADAFVQAAHHWRKLWRDPQVEAWVRNRAFRACSRPLNRGLAPWYVRARQTDDAHRALLLGLSELSPPERKLVILRQLVGLSLPQAAREAGVPDRVAEEMWASSAASLGGRGVVTSPDALARQLADLRHDLANAPIDRALALRREGTSRRRKHLLLLGLCSVALAIGAGALVVADPAPRLHRLEPGIDQTTPTEAPNAPEVSVTQLLDVSQVEQLDRDRRWKAQPITQDLEPEEVAYNVCLPVIPVDRRAEHFWVSSMTAGRQSPTEFTQSLEVSRTPEASERSFQRQVSAYTSCPAVARHLVRYDEPTVTGDEAAVVALDYVTGRSIQRQYVALSRTGLAVTSLVVTSPAFRPVSPSQVFRLLTSATNSLCPTSQGACASRRAVAKPVLPAGEHGAVGFMAAIDLPVFADLPDPWVGTNPTRVRPNPASTLCDNSDFLANGAQRVASRYFVVPTAPKLADIFGMSQTIGSFSNAKAARTFVASTARTIAGCHDRQLSLEVTGTKSFEDNAVRGQLWAIELRTSQNASTTVRMFMVRAGADVAQLTFSPTARYDLSQAQFEALAFRAGHRLAQRS